MYFVPEVTKRNGAFTHWYSEINLKLAIVQTVKRTTNDILEAAKSFGMNQTESMNVSWLKDI